MWVWQVSVPQWFDVRGRRPPPYPTAPPAAGGSGTGNMPSCLAGGTMRTMIDEAGQVG
jgi:hypothetical protein